jgi:hypothetical protein
MSGTIVFRGSASPPDLKFPEGFYPRHARQGGVQIQSGGQMLGAPKARLGSLHLTDARRHVRFRNFP